MPRVGGSKLCSSFSFRSRKEELEVYESEPETKSCESRAGAQNEDDEPAGDSGKMYMKKDDGSEQKEQV